MDYSSHTYPRTLAENFIVEWPEISNLWNDLPPKEALISLLSEAFQASLLRGGPANQMSLVLVNPLELSEAEGGHCCLISTTTTFFSFGLPIIVNRLRALLRTSRSYSLLCPAFETPFSLMLIFGCQVKNH